MRGINDLLEVNLDEIYCMKGQCGLSSLSTDIENMSERINIISGSLPESLSDYIRRDEISTILSNYIPDSLSTQIQNLIDAVNALSAMISANNFWIQGADSTVNYGQSIRLGQDNNYITIATQA